MNSLLFTYLFGLYDIKGDKGTGWNILLTFAAAAAATDQEQDLDQPGFAALSPLSIILPHHLSINPCLSHFSFLLVNMFTLGIMKQEHIVMGEFVFTVNHYWKHYHSLQLQMLTFAYSV